MTGALARNDLNASLDTGTAAALAIPAAIDNHSTTVQRPLGNPMALDDEMRRSAPAQVLAHRQACLAAADDARRLHFYD